MSARRHAYYNKICQKYSNGMNNNNNENQMNDGTSFANSRNVNNFNGENKMAKRLIWVDCEMTGLDLNTCHLLEVACLITDENLNVVAEGPDIVIQQPEEILKSMNSWCMKQHTKSGLVGEVQASRTSLTHAEYELLSFVRQHTPPGICPLAGNSVHVDKTFLEKFMPKFCKHLHYRIVDVSTIKELANRWYPNMDPPLSKQMSHRAMNDIKESVAELLYFKKTLFKEIL